MNSTYTRVIELLSKMVSIPSVNPGKGPVSEIHLEQRMADFLYNYFKEKEYSYEISYQEVLPKRPNIFVWTGRDPQKKTLLLETHMDTVGIDNMTIDPFNPIIRDGKLFGRGSCDAKGQLTAMIVGMEMALEETEGNLPINVCLAATVDEEHLHRGVDRIVDDRFQADGAVVGEPTEMRLVTATKGSIRFQIHTKGKAAHSADPHMGINAIYIMAEVIQAISKVMVPLLKERVHPLCGPATISATIIKGGHQVNIVPDDCVLDVDRRLLPGEDWKTAYEEIKQIILEQVDSQWKDFVIFDSPYLIDPALETKKDSSIVQAFSRVLKEQREDPREVGVSFGTDASKIALLNIPTVVFGPGSIRQAHTEDEWIKVEEIVKAAEVYKQLILNFH